MPTHGRPEALFNALAAFIQLRRQPEPDLLNVDVASDALRDRDRLSPRCRVCGSRGAIARGWTRPSAIAAPAVILVGVVLPIAGTAVSLALSSAVAG